MVALMTGAVLHGRKRWGHLGIHHQGEDEGQRKDGDGAHEGDKVSKDCAGMHVSGLRHIHIAISRLKHVRLGNHIYDDHNTDASMQD